MAKSIWDFFIALFILWIGMLFMASGVGFVAGVAGVITAMFVALR